VKLTINVKSVFSILKIFFSNKSKWIPFNMKMWTKQLQTIPLKTENNRNFGLILLNQFLPIGVRISRNFTLAPSNSHLFFHFDLTFWFTIEEIGKKYSMVLQHSKISKLQHKIKKLNECTSKQVYYNLIEVCFILFFVICFDNKITKMLSFWYCIFLFSKKLKTNNISRI
jgi:hypothetical protein